MTTIRRLLAVFLIPVFAASLVVTLVIIRVNDTLLDPGFYAGVLHRLEAYDFFYDTVLPSILDRAGLDVTRAPSSLGLSAEGLSAKMRRIIPPETLELQVRTAIERVLPYLTGNADAFELTMEPGRWVEEAADVIRDLVREPELYDYLLDDLARAPLQPQWSTFESSLPFPLELTLDDVLQDVKTVWSAPWLAEQTGAVLDGFVPYVTGKTESFSVVIRLDERASAGIQVLRGWMHRILEGGGYDYLVREAAPRLRLLLASSRTLPYSVSFSDEELGTIIALVLPMDWVKAQLDRGIGALESYLTGRAQSGAFSIPLDGRADAASLLLAAAANVKARAAYDGLRECNAIEEHALGTIPEVLPNCRVPGLDYDKVRARAGFDTVVVLRRVFARLPESIDVTEDELRAAINRSGDGPALEALRKTLIDGYRFDVRELRRLLEAGAPAGQRSGASWDRFQSFRIQLRDGIRFTDRDLRRAADRETLGALDRTRWWLGFARWLLVVLAAAVAFLAVGIARLGGRSRESRLVWGGSALLLGGSVVVGVAIGIEALRGLATPAIEGLAAGRFTDKLLELRDELFTTFTGPLVVQGIVVALAGLALVIWGFYRARGVSERLSAAR